MSKSVLFLSAILFAGLVTSPHAEATSSKLIDLDKEGRSVIWAKVGAMGAGYAIDPQACVCTFTSDIGKSSIAVDCKKLAVYPELTAIVEKCK